MMAFLAGTAIVSDVIGSKRLLSGGRTLQPERFGREARRTVEEPRVLPWYHRDGRVE
jgi:hypothetical protein